MGQTAAAAPRSASVAARPTARFIGLDTLTHWHRSHHRGTTSHKGRQGDVVVLGGAASLFIGNAFQAAMPEFAHDLGTTGADFTYSALLGANAAGAVVGGILLDATGWLLPTVRSAIVCAMLWCGAMGVDNLVMLSDHRSGSFGSAYGTLIEDLRIHSRAIFVIVCTSRE